MELIMKNIQICKNIKCSLLKTNMQVATMSKAMGLQGATQLLLVTIVDISNT